MDAKINYTLQDSNSLDATVTKHKDEMTAKGFEEASHQSLKDLRQDLVLKEAAQEKAEEKLTETTAAQNKTSEEIYKIIGLVKTAAKSAYGKDKSALKLFKVGDSIPRSISGLETACDYTLSIVNERKADLLKSGVTQQMIDRLASGRTDLEAVDKAQEEAKKERKSATLERDLAHAKLKDRMARIRNFAKVTFADSAAVLLEFKPIPKGRGGSSGGGETPPANTDKPAN